MSSGQFKDNSVDWLVGLEFNVLTTLIGWMNEKKIRILNFSD